MKSMEMITEDSLCPLLSGSAKHVGRDIPRKAHFRLLGGRRRKTVHAGKGKRENERLKIA